ncbi:Bud-site selection protein [Punctularia strigosozonata HHB-11173 SS5]|uniref:Bud-site selection protein n=1 Tax=Punctularia strigosozonata (strain HHB-11173) TaxID=741275 RepID=UPI00044171D9|nr:Bud-site selection protein [Punctularia strigosozonata HHB-11173 SS5]EIN12616.1 Bud-site selection protein [Punctularia strigosozonata HHB-11173 SS5]
MSPEIVDLEKQLEILKAVDFDIVAETALKTKIMKDKLLSSNDAVRDAVQAELSSTGLAPEPPGTPAAKVHGRLLSSKVLATQINLVVNALRTILQPALSPSSADEASAEWSEPPPKKSKTKPKELAPHISPALRDAKVSDSGEGSDEDGDESDARELVSDDDGDVAADDAGWESGSVDDGEGGWESGTVSSDHSDEVEDQSNEEAGETEKKPARPERPPAKAKASIKAGESTFLPSLAVGFTRGDSDSEFSDSEAKFADGVKKNRRGQRARRAIWEKKFGRNANHVKKQREEIAAKGSRDRRAPRAGPGRPGPQRNNDAPRMAFHGNDRKLASGANQIQRAQAAHATADAGAKPPKRNQDRPLHPSWEAKKRLKEKQSMGIVPAQGTKIKF